MKSLLHWLDDRTGYRALFHDALYERIPGGARYRYAWGSTLVFIFLCQMITGVFLWMAYSPSTQTAWESVYYIQNEMAGGWLLRGIHHYMAQAMVVLLVLHLFQVVIDGAYRAPRELNFWVGLILLQVCLAMALTGYLLPWDQRGYRATGVSTNIMSNVPVLGRSIEAIAVGGPDFGQHTLTRFFALHAGVLPAVLLILIVIHVKLAQRHGRLYKQPFKKPDGVYWPDQVVKNSVVCLAVLAFVLFAVFKGMFLGHEAWNGQWSSLGAALEAPADAANPYLAARPEWYFLFLFQTLKILGPLVGALIIPGIVFLLFFLMPVFGRTKSGHVWNVTFLVIVFCCIGTLMLLALYDDYHSVWTDGKSFANYQKQTREIFGDQEPLRGSIEEANKVGQYFKDDDAKIYEFYRQQKAFDAYRLSVEHLQHLSEGHREALRARELAAGPHKIPPTGALTLMREDPKTVGPRLFAKYCVTCHTHFDPKTATPTQLEQLAKSSAPNLYGFASRSWIRGLLDPKRIDTPEYFGHTAHKEGEMVGYVKETMHESLNSAQLEAVIAALSAQAQLPRQQTIDRASKRLIEVGNTLLASSDHCAACHQFDPKAEQGSGPSLVGYGSQEWIERIIANPTSPGFYPESNDRMPAFAKHPDHAELNLLSPEKIRLLARWLRGDWYEATPQDDVLEYAAALSKTPPSADQPAKAK
jgi:quinol-cytochrome oxidoreductase complex cytochrome b subunit/mono/diheme cytochrome c family protein